MKVCFVNTLYYPHQVGGAERSVQILAESLVALGHEAVVITLGEQQQDTEHQGVKIYRRRLANLYWPFDGDAGRGIGKKMIWHALDSYNPAMSRVVGAILDAEKPDVVHTNNIGGFSISAWQAAKSRGQRLVHTLRDYYLLCYRTTMYKHDRNCEAPCTDCGTFARIKRWSGPQPDCVVGISEYILDRHLKFGFFPGSKRKVIFNAYDAPDGWQPDTARVSMTFGYVGRLAESKGVDRLIEAFKNARLPNGAVLLVAGTGDEGYVDRLKRLAQGHAIEFIGRADIRDFFKLVDFTIVPSLWNEPLGRVVLESYAFGVPVLASRSGALPEIVQQGRTGYMFSTWQEMTDLLGWVCTLPPAERSNLARHCKEDALAKFSSRHIVSEYLDAYQGT